MNPFAVSGFLIVLTCFPLAGFILLKAPRSVTTRLLMWFNVTVGLWGLGVMLVGLARTPREALWAWRLGHAGGFWLGIIFYHLATVLCGVRHRHPIRAAYLFAVVSIMLCMTGPAMSQTIWRFGGLHYHKANALYGVIFIIWCSIVAIGHGVLWRGYHQAIGDQRRKLQYVFYAMAIGFGGGTSTLLPMFGLPLYPYGNFTIPIYSLVVTYAIVKHHLLDIRVAIKKSLVYSLLIACLTATYLVVVLFAERWFQGYLGYHSWSVTVFVSFLIAIFFNPLRNRIQAFVDRALFKATPAELMEQREHLLVEVRKGDQMKAVATLAAGLAHEIKNPLASIKTFTESLGSHAQDPVFLVKFQRIVGGEVERINSIVQQLLEFAKPVPPKLMPVEVPKLVDETLEFLGNELVNHHVEVNRQYVGQSKVLADPKQLRQVFLNLFLNSLQAMNSHHGRLEVETNATGAELEIIIADNGPGISPKDLPHIFEPFYTTKESGTGLGLAVVQGIIKEHGGRIHVTSQPGQGTTMKITLPIAT